MSGAGSAIGGILTVGGIFLAYASIFTLTDKGLILGLFFLFGLLGGIALGSLNSRKARTRMSYAREYQAYASAFFAAIVFFAIYLYLFAADSIGDITTSSDFSGTLVITIALVSGLLTFFGVGLVIANIVAED